MKERTIEVPKNELMTDLLFERKLDTAVDGLPRFYRKCIMNLLGENTKLVVDFINFEVQYNNIKVSSKKNKIQGIVRFAKFLNIKYGHDKPFKQYTRQDFIDFQTSLRRSEEADPLHKWVGTYNQFLRMLKPFYKWLYAPEQEGKIRKLPPILEGINQLHRKEVTTYTAKDMWTDEDDQLFLKYCEDPLIRLYHTMSRDVSDKELEKWVRESYMDKKGFIRQ
jgi:hypothetical protein